MAKQSMFAGQRFLVLPMTGRRLRGIATTALFHTLFNDFASEADGTTFVQTGDIPAMWLRDSSAQTLPYIRFEPRFPALRERFAGVIERNARNILIDPYANAFTTAYRVWEEKWEVDSLAFPLRLTWTYWRQTGDRTIFTRSLHKALRRIVSTYQCEQEHERCSHYTFAQRVPTHYNYAAHTGMIWCAFRPSDDPVQYRYNIPQQMYAVVAMRAASDLARDGYNDLALARSALAVSLEVDRGIVKYGSYYNFLHGWTYVYETDGEGHYNLMDDANIPNLLAIPQFGYRSARDPQYLNTRAWVLSADNPYYYRGKYAMGLGSPHTPVGWIWPLGIITRALTSTSAAETQESITTLAETDSSEFLIHESFDPNAYWHFTRAEFGWANALYAELIFRSIAGYPAYDDLPGPNAAQLEPPARTPTLTPMIVQLQNQARLTQALGELLAMLH